MTAWNNKKGKEPDLKAYLYASDKARLVSMVKKMAASAGKSLEDSILALVTFNLELAQKVIDDDDFIDEMEELIDQECLYSIAMRQPMREDLRFVYAVMKIITDLERIGDQSVNVALRLQKMSAAGGAKPCPMIEQINDMAQDNIKMLKEVVDAFVSEDETIIYSIRVKRRKVHKTRDNVIEALMKISTESNTEEVKTNVLFVAMWIVRHLSRISDHVLNLAEKVSFIVTGISPLTLKKRGQKDAFGTKELPLEE